MAIYLTDSAAERIRNFLAARGRGLGLRLVVLGLGRVPEPLRRRVLLRADHAAPDRAPSALNATRAGDSAVARAPNACDQAPGATLCASAARSPSRSALS